jgi:hypothetical protein
MKAAIVLMIALGASAALGSTESDGHLARVRRFATNAYDEQNRVKKLCFCRNAGDLTGRTGVLRWHEPAGFPGVQYHLNCEAQTFDATTGEIVSVGYCSDFEPLGD